MLNNRSRIKFSQVLLSYLLSLYLIGFSWHLYVHTQDSLHNEVAHADSIAVSEDTCAACEWLTHHHFTLGSLAEYASLLPTDFIDVWEEQSANYFFQSIIKGSSRAPPLG